MIMCVHCPSESFEGIYNGLNMSGWRCGYKFKAFGEHRLELVWYLVVCEVDNKVVLCVILYSLSVLVFVSVFAAGSPVRWFMKEAFYCFPFMNMLYMMGNFL